MHIAICAIRAGAAECWPVRCRQDTRAGTESGWASFPGSGAATVQPTQWPPAGPMPFAIPSSCNAGKVFLCRIHQCTSAPTCFLIAGCSRHTSPETLALPLHPLSCSRPAPTGIGITGCRRRTDLDTLVSPLYCCCTRCWARPAAACLSITECSQCTDLGTLTNKSSPNTTTMAV